MSVLKHLKQKIRRYLPDAGKEIIPHVHLEGVIGSVKSIGRKGICFDSIKPALDEAFNDEDVTNILLSINSPGGSPVQSSLIYQYIVQLKKKKSKKVYAFVHDVAASGGYYIACAADEIYADNHSIVGSIGVIAGGFGFVDAIDKLGVQRRVYTSGQSKSMLDPFLPENPDHIDHLKTLQNEIHQGFIDVVKESRGKNLDEQNDDELFSGKFWTGKKSHHLGLIDGIASLHGKMTELFGDEFKLVPIKTDKKSFLEKYAGLHADTLADNIKHNIIEASQMVRFR
jgi:signal peptide peptidase SppA